MLSRILLLIVYVLLTPGLVAVTRRLCTSLVEQPALAARLAVGVVLGLLLHQHVLRRVPGYITLQHECKHAVMSLLFLRRIRGFVVTLRRGGMVRHTHGFGGALGDHAIGLAPYFLLLLAFPAAVLLPVLSDGWLVWGQLVLGCLVAIDLSNISVDLRHNFNREVFQTVVGDRALSDIGRRGYVFTIASIAFHGFVQLALVLQLVTLGYGGLPALGKALWLAWWDTGAWLLSVPV